MLLGFSVRHDGLMRVCAQAYSWGGNEYGQCAQEAEEVLEPTPCLPHLRARQVAAGGMHSCLLTTDGEVGLLLHFHWLAHTWLTRYLRCVCQGV